MSDELFTNKKKLGRKIFNFKNSSEIYLHNSLKNKKKICGYILRGLNHNIYHLEIFFFDLFVNDIFPEIHKSKNYCHFI